MVFFNNTYSRGFGCSYLSYCTWKPGDNCYALLFIKAVMVAGVAIVMYPILKTHNEALALGYVGARITEAYSLLLLYSPY
jgi:hypothetical protein